MSLPQQPQPPASITAYWQAIGRVFAQLLTEHAHADLVITVREGKVTLTRIDRRYLPTEVPKV